MRPRHRPTLLIIIVIYVLQCGPGIEAYPWPAEQLASCFAGKTLLTPGKVARPTTLNHPLFPVAAAAVTLICAWVAWKLYYLPFMQHPAIWAILGLMLFLFSTGGGMYNIIRQVPLFSYDDKGKVIWWMQVRACSGFGVSL